MAQMTSDGAESDSQPPSGSNETGETAETGGERQVVPDHKQEPGDNNECRAGMDGSGGRGAAMEPEDNTSSVPEPGTQTAAPGEKADDNEGHLGAKLLEPGKSIARSSLSRSTESTQEQRDGENVFSSVPSERTKSAERPEHGTKRRASVERTSSDGEPLSRMDSEDRSVELTLVKGNAPCSVHVVATNEPTIGNWNLVWLHRTAQKSSPSRSKPTSTYILCYIIEILALY